MNQTIVAALWGFAGAAPHAGTRLATALWGSAEIPARAKKLAAAHFVIAMFAGPALAAAAAPELQQHARGASLAAVAIVVGYLGNAIWPLLNDKRLLMPLLRAFAGQMGGWLSGLGRASNEAPDDI